MKKVLILLTIFSFVCSLNVAFALQTNFSRALSTCESFSQNGSISHEGEIFNILVTLEKKADKCVYKEKIYQGKEYQMLTCHFDKGQLPAMTKSMEKYSEVFKKELAKNKIFEAKMTTNGEVFNRYLANPKYCQITHSKK